MALRHRTHQPSQQNIIVVGQLTTIHKLNNKTVRKLPSDKSYIYNNEAIKIESRIYNHLGRHNRIARWITCSEDYVDLRYELNGDFESYLKQNPLTSHDRCRIARQAIEAVVFTHGKDVIHSDSNPRQFLDDKDCNIRLSDFGGSSVQGSEAIAMENAMQFLPRDEDSPNTVESDLFALGSTVYGIFVSRRPYEGEVRRRFEKRVFPVLDGVGDRG